MMDRSVDETELLAWLDGELEESEAARVAQIVSADPALSERAEAHRRLQARFAAAFDPIAATPIVEKPVLRVAPVLSLAAARAERAAKVVRPPRRWALPGALAASLVVGLLIGHGFGMPTGVADRPGALALSKPIAQALDAQLSGEAGPVRVALSFRDRSGNFCRSFTATYVAGVACRDRADWALRYAAPGAPEKQGAYRMAGDDSGSAQVVAAMIVGDPLNSVAERAARMRGWR